jgi:F0F1-type ATP synthase membrane subunit c/vacuolar-type H+-ATPase subunit K
VSLQEALAEPLEMLPLCASVLPDTDELSARILQEETQAEMLEEEPSGEMLFNLIGATLCVCTAALAAGLTLGMLGMDPLMLLIKERASEDPKERQQAHLLLPLVKQHHRLLVTLLLMNSISNEGKLHSPTYSSQTCTTH